MKQRWTLAAILVCTAPSLYAQDTGTIAGTVTLEETGAPVHGALVLVIGPGKFATTDGDGRYGIADLEPGTYAVIAQREHLASERASIVVTPDSTAELDFLLGLSPIHEEITVTASASGGTTALDAFNVVESLDSFKLAGRMAGTLGEVLEEEPGVSKRSFGPGSTRPIIRGFDGDRVLIMQDGVRTGDLSSQSGDHGTSIDPANLERLEVLKGPATLLYGSNAVGGVVNAITPQDGLRDSDAEGFKGQVTGDAGTANAQVGLNGTAQVRRGPWAAWFGGGARRAGDYDTPIGTIENSKTSLKNARGGFGYFAKKAYASLGFQVEDGRHGVPFAGEFHEHEEESEHEEEVFVDLDFNRQSARADLGLRDLSSRFLSGAKLVVNWIGWRHDEIEVVEGIESIGTMFENDEFLGRLEFEQKSPGRLSGKFGAWGRLRDYNVIGEEALAPPTKQSAVAGFFYEELDFGRTRVQFGGRLEHNDFDPEPRRQGDAEAPEAKPRSFTGLSASVGTHVSLGDDSAIVANLTASSRAPALEELYNFGPHVGTLTFEIGNPDLEMETTLGADVSLRHQGARTRAKANLFYYDIGDFIFLAPTGEVVDSLPEGRYEQGDARFTGVDFGGSIAVSEQVWLHASLGYVSAKLTGPGEPLPRIPPLHGNVAVEWLGGALTLRPELVWGARQDDVFTNELPTDGYAVLNVTASYILAQSHAAHIFALRGYNLTNELYRNHTSFIKELAPEIGRGVKATYTLRFF